MSRGFVAPGRAHSVRQTALVRIFRRPAVARLAARGIHGLTALVGRTAAQRAQARLPEFRCDREIVGIPTSYGVARAWIYRPQRGTEAAPPVHLNLHGGGFVIGFPEQDDALCRALCALTGSVVVNADYVLAPRHPFPSAVEQSYEIARWVAGPGSAYGWDGSRLTIGGQSAGGSLAAAVARLAWERGGPEISLQVLHYPALDLTVPVAAKTSPVAKPLLSPWLSELFDTCYLPDRSRVADRLVSPAGAGDRADLTGIAPAMIIAAAQDVLLAEAERYASRLARPGALDELVIVADRDHGYDQSDDEQARLTYRRIADRLLVAHG